MTAALGFYRHVVDVREDFGDQLGMTQVTAARRVIMDRMTDELRGAIVYPFLRFGMSGQEMEMRFMTAALPSRAVWAVGEVTDEPVPPEHDLQIVGYCLRYGEDEDGMEIVEGLQRTVQRIVAAETAEEGEEIQAALIAPQFKFISLRYWDGQAGDWLTSWEGGDLPMAVEIVLGTEPLPEDLEVEDYPFETFRRVVYVPRGATQFEGTTIIRGLGGAGS